MNADTIIQSAFTAMKNVRWRDCEGTADYEWYYAEDCHYIVRNKVTSACWFVRAKSPNSAFEIVMKKINERN